MAGTFPIEKPQRLVSLDAYRGFIMLAMVSGGLGFSAVAREFPDSWAWQALAYQFSHVEWTGCGFWDLIQPSFMFMVGVAMPFSHVSRRAKGYSIFRIGVHTVYRAVFLVALAVFLSSNSSRQTNFVFTNVLAQIGMGYCFVYLLVGCGFRIQLMAAAAILVRYGWYFYAYETPGPDAIAALGLPDDWQQFTGGLGAQWNKHVNAAAEMDRWFLDLFPRASSDPVVNGGGYTTLNFVPSMATMIFGLMAGNLLRSPRTLRDQCRLLIAAGAACLFFGLAVDGTIWPYFDWQWTLCPIVKRIWTPSWAVFSTGWTLWMLAAFFYLIEIRGYRRWAFPLVVVGMNSIAMYGMAQLVKGWVRGSLNTHLETVRPQLIEKTGWAIGDRIFDSTYGPILQSVSVLLVLWLICLWMYRRKIFLRI